MSFDYVGDREYREKHFADSWNKKEKILNKKLKVTVHLVKQEGCPAIAMNFKDCRTPQIMGPMYVVQSHPDEGSRRMVETAITIHSIAYIESESVEEEAVIIRD